MAESKDYTTMSQADLMAEQNKLKSQKIPVALAVGFLAGIAVYSAVKNNGIFLPIILLVAAGWISNQHNKRLKSVEEEMARRGA
jgi:hypothetical protein